MGLEDLSLLELKEKAKEKGLKNLSKLKKEEIINLLNESEDVKLEDEQSSDTS